MSLNVGSIGCFTSTEKTYSPPPTTSGNVSLAKRVTIFALACIASAYGNSLEVTPGLSSSMSLVRCPKIKYRPDSLAETDLSLQRFLNGDVVNPSRKKAIVEFPKDICNIATQSGVYLLDGGWSGCDIGEFDNQTATWPALPDPKECKKRIKTLEQVIGSHLGKPMSHSCEHLNRWHIDDGHPITDVSLDMSPDRMNACMDSYRYIQESFLQKLTTTTKSFSSAQINNLLLQIHAHAYHGPLKAGEFRKEMTHINYGPFSQQLRLDEGTEDDYKILQSIFELVDRFNSSIDDLMSKGNFSDEQLNLLKRVAIIPPNPTKLRDQLKVFTRKLGERLGSVLERREDAISVGAWAYMQILRMHPFMDGNTRVARVMLNTILQIGGYQAIGFPDKERFYASLSSPQEFRKHVAEVVKWNQSQRALKV